MAETVDNTEVLQFAENGSQFGINLSDGQEYISLAEVLDTTGISLNTVDAKQMLMSYIENSFPTIQFEEYVDDNGNTRSKPVYDSEGNAVINREAVRQKEMLLDTLGSIKVPASALDMIINHFGSDIVVENTGRKRRVVVKDGKAKEENIANKKEADVTAFQNGDNDIRVDESTGAILR